MRASLQLQDEKQSVYGDQSLAPQGSSQRLVIGVGFEPVLVGGVVDNFLNKMFNGFTSLFSQLLRHPCLLQAGLFDEAREGCHAVW